MTTRWQKLYDPDGLKGVKEPTQSEDHRVGKAKEKCRLGGMRSK